MALKSFDNPNTDEARQFLLDRRCERLHPKRHRTKNRSKRLKEAKKEKAKALRMVASKKRKAFLNQSRLYWAGADIGHPTVD